MLSREVSGARAEQRRLVDAPPDLETLAQVADRYGLTFEFRVDREDRAGSRVGEPLITSILRINLAAAASARGRRDSTDWEYVSGRVQSV
jgi:hypothetical protein